MPQRLIAMLPVRNGEQDLPGYLDSVRTLCDGVVALDDGSTDGTLGLLQADPLVLRVLTNPRRDDARGWDDAANRNRLLTAVDELEPDLLPDWLISLDADERITGDDAIALREFLETDALPGVAYGFRHVAMRAEGEVGTPGATSDTFRPLRDQQWVYRLFAWERGLRFPNQLLHFIPVPTTIARPLWVQTTLRIQHFGGATGERRLRRFTKYLEADPERRFQGEYAQLLAGPRDGELTEWQPRRPGQPVLLADTGATVDWRDSPVEPVEPVSDHADDQTDDGSEEPVDDPTADPGDDALALSAIVISYNDEATIARTVASVAGQDVSEPFEVIVVTSGTDRTAAIVRNRFPGVRVVELPGRALPGEARNAGLRLATGTYVSFPGSHVELAPGSLEARLRAHRRGHVMVTGVATNGTDTRSGWASYFIDHHLGLPGHRPARLNGPPAHCSYARLPLVMAGGFPEGVRTAEDTSVNARLFRAGYSAVRDPAVRFSHRSPCRTPRKLITHHFSRGRGWGRLGAAALTDGRETLDWSWVRPRLFRHVVWWMHRIDTSVGLAEAEVQARYAVVRPLVRLAVMASWAGMWVELLRLGPGRLLQLAMPRSWTVLTMPRTDKATLSVTRLEPSAGVAQVIHLNGVSPDTSPEAIATLERRLGFRVDQVLMTPLPLARLRWVALRGGHRRNGGGRTELLRQIATAVWLTRRYRVVTTDVTLASEPEPGLGRRSRQRGRMSL